jgi:hypothetical protein
MPRPQNALQQPWEARQCVRPASRSPEGRGRAILRPSEAAMTVSTAIQPIECDGRFWVEVVIDGHETNRYGPYANIGAAEAVARQIAGVCRSLFQSGPIVVRQPASGLRKR